MATIAAELPAGALSLPEATRAGIAVSLIESLIGPADEDAGQAWNQLVTGLWIGLGLGAAAPPNPNAGFQYFSIPTAGSVPHRITVGPDGAIWFTESATNRIGRITLAGTVAEYQIPAPDIQPENITVGPDGNLWFTELSRPSEKFLIQPSRKFLLTALRLKDGTNCDEPSGTGRVGLAEAR